MTRRLTRWFRIARSTNHPPQIDYLSDHMRSDIGMPPFRDAGAHLRTWF
ncbi:hypothetical protein SLH49_03050 [Cognatiyoonia sp. IB215446]|nr:hypothetical protein [Cognatiyoonia sp. IB215446]MDX8346954.1 hypothetical protein [Cognatiyoonia sp. IB215446]